jgi:hypothetical protein
MGNKAKAASAEALVSQLSNEGQLLLTLQRRRLADGLVKASTSLSLVRGQEEQALQAALAKLFPGHDLPEPFTPAAAPLPPPAAPSAAKAPPPPVDPPATPRKVPPPQAPPTKEEAAAAVARLRRLAEPLWKEIATLRGLVVKRQLPIEFLGDEEFRAALHQLRSEQLARLAREELARWIAFGFGPASSDPAKIDLENSGADGVLGFYEPRTRRLVVRLSLAADAQREQPLKTTLAHEIEHALQDQNFGLRRLDPATGLDELLALRSVYEGDATLAQGAWELRQAGRPLKAGLAAWAEGLRERSISALLDDTGYAASLEGASPLLRDRVLFPYVHGLAFATHVFRAGGFKLLDQTFARPPVSTHQVLHPEAYLRGDQPVRVEPPPAPPGTKKVASGRLGEVAVRALLTLCGDGPIGLATASDWAGDGYTIFEQDGQLRLLWRTVWSSKDAAQRFADVIELQFPCWDAAAQDAAPGAWQIGPGHTAVNRGRTVTVTRGLGLHPAGSDTNGGFAFTEPKRVPFEFKPLLADTPPQLIGDDFVDGRLGFSAKVPRGYVQVPEAGSELALVRREPLGVISLGYVTDRLDEQTRKNTYQKTTASLLRAIPGGSRLTSLGPRAAKVFGVEAEEFRWKAGPSLVIGVVCVPLCGGRSYLEVSMISESDAVLPAWLSTFQQLGAEPPVCADLD